MSNKPTTKLISGFTEVVTAGTAVQLSTAFQETAMIAVQISFSNSNTGTQVAIGGSKETTAAKKELSKEQGVILLKGSILRIEINDLSRIWVDVEKSKDGVSWLAEVA